MFSCKTQINKLFHLNDSTRMVEFSRMEISENVFKQSLDFFCASASWSHLTVRKRIQKSRIDPASARTVKIDPDVAVGLLSAIVIKTVETVAVSCADDGRGLQMQQGIIQFQINGAGTDHFKRKGIRFEVPQRMDVTAVKGAVIDMSDEQVVKIKNCIQNPPDPPDACRCLVVLLSGHYPGFYISAVK